MAAPHNDGTLARLGDVRCPEGELGAADDVTLQRLVGVDEHERARGVRGNGEGLLQAERSAAA